jgi:hypothetical protein
MVTECDSSVLKAEETRRVIKSLDQRREQIGRILVF